MLKRIVTVSWAILVLLGVPVAGGVALYASPALAEEGEPPRETRRVPAMSEATFKKLTEAQEAVDAKNYQGALQTLNAMLQNTKNLNGNEVGQVNNMLGFVYFSMEDYDRAIRSYQNVIAQGEDIPEGLEVTTLYTLAQLSFVAERYQDALDYMEKWITRANNPGPDPHIFMGQVYYQMEKYPQAIQQIEKGIQIAKQRDMEIKEQWWALLNFLYYEQENWPKVLETLEILVRDFPKREYWIRLAGIHGQEGNDKESVWTYEAAYAGGFLTKQSDLTNFAGLLMQEEVPYRAARVLDKGIKDGIVEESARTLQSLGQAWQLAQETEKAIPVFEKAAQMSDDGKIYERLAQLYLDNDEFSKCVTSADGAIQKGGLRKVQSVYIVKGMCLYNADRLSTARTAFVSCRNEARREKDDNNQRICQQWITYIDRETNRREQLESAI